ncbi:hypothetical protein Mapa_006222 [Marchantia paleacea]|nr:hypothetical protein Mapa_006222 [Marchantia paleacea]
MIGLPQLPQLGEKLLMLTSLCHHGRGGSSGVVIVRSWVVGPPVMNRKRRVDVPSSLTHPRPFAKSQLSSADFGSRYAFVNCFVTHVLKPQVYNRPNAGALSLKGNCLVTSFSSESLSEESPRQDLSTFRPPPPAPPVRPEHLLSEVPFQYWYSYADLPDNRSRKKDSKQSGPDDPNRSVTRVKRDTADSSYLKPEDRRRLLLRELRKGTGSDVVKSEEPRRSLTRDLKDSLGSASRKPEEPIGSAVREWVETAGRSIKRTEETKRSLMRERRVISGVSSATEDRSLTRETVGNTECSTKSEQPRRSLMREPRKNSRSSSPRRGNGVAAITSTLQSNDGTAREELSHTFEVQDTTVVEKDCFGEREPNDTSEQGSFAERDSSEESEREKERTTSTGTTEDTEKEAFRLSTKEINLLIDKGNRSSRQINIGWRGWGHNYITLVHSYWKKSEVCKIKCKGAVTLDMDFLCNKLEEKTGGKVIHRNLGVVYLYRGRDYDPKFAPKLPVMHQRKKTPAKRLPIPFGLTKDDVNALRARGKELPALCKLAKNGVYVTLLDDVRKAFEKSDLVRVNCQGFEARNFRTLGVKLKKLVPCVLISYEFEHILMWRWDGFKAPSPEDAAQMAEESFKDEEDDAEH